MSFAPDGSVLTWGVGPNFGLLPPDSPGPPRAPLWESSALERNPAVSPGGRWLAFESDRTGGFEIYVRSFPALNEEWQVSTRGGCCPVWARDGTELYYWRDDEDGSVSIMAVPVGPGVPPTWGPHTVAANGFYARASWDTSYDVGLDGRFLLMKSTLPPPPNEIRVVLNWDEELKRLVPTR
jgi:hypothetical protein